MAFDPHQPQHQLSAALAGPRFDRLVQAFGVAAMSSAIANFETLPRAMLFAAAARACGPFDTGSARTGRPVSVNALAASLHRPFETTRRNANALIELGLLARTDGGLHVPVQVISDPRAAMLSDQCHDLLVRLVEDARAANLALPTARADIAYDPRTGIGIAFDLLLAVFECHHQRDRNPLRIALLTATEWANAHNSGVTTGASVAVKPSVIARMLGLPYATAARNLDLLVKEGELVRLPEGLSVPQARRDHEPAAEARLALANRARQLIGRLGQAGFPVQQPATGYIRARPLLPAST